MECKYAVYLERVGAEVVECACVIGLPEVKVLLKPLQLKSVCLLLIGLQLVQPVILLVICNDSLISSVICWLRYLCDYLSSFQDYKII